MRLHLIYIYIYLCTTFTACANPFDSEDQERTKKIQNYIDTYKQIAIEEMYLMGIPASITLAQGLLETNFGESKLAREANNHFGIKCKAYWKGETYYADDDTINECFRKYPSGYDSYIDHSMFLRFHHSHKYDKLFLLQQTDYIGWANGLQELGYATNRKYAEIIIHYITTYQLDRFDSERFLVAEKYKDKSYVVVPPKPNLLKTESANASTINNNQKYTMQPPNPNPQTTINPNMATGIGNIAKNLKQSSPTISPTNQSAPIGMSDHINNQISKNPSQQTREINLVDAPQTETEITETEIEAFSVQNISINNCKAFIFNRDLYPSYIAFKYNLPLNKVYEYNDLPLGATLKANIPVFITPKKKLPETDKQIHIVQNNQTMSDIAQLYGIQLKHLCKRNKLKPETTLKTGEFIYLQGNKPQENKKL